MTLPALTRSGAALQVAGVNRRLSGLNAYWLGLDDNAGVNLPSHATITAAFDGMQAMHCTHVRAHTVGISAGTSLSYLTGYLGTAPVYVEGNMDSADWAVYQAGLHDVYLMCPLTDNWNYYHGGLWNFVHWAYQQNSSGITDVNGSIKDDPNNRQFFANTAPGLRIRALFKAYITRWLNHVNPYTGLAYKDDPTIAIVETGNEIYYAAQLGSNEWTQDIASTVKSIAPGKLVADGSAASGQATSTMPGLTAAAVDIVGGHYYPQRASAGYTSQTFTSTDSSFPAGSARQQLAADVTAAAGSGKAFILGEYPWTRSDVAAWWSDIEANAGIDVDMAWSFIPGTETHGGAFGSDDYPVHYPYLGATEQTYAPALAAHIGAVNPSSGTVQVSRVRVAASAAAGKVQVSRIRVAVPVDVGTVQVSRIYVAAIPSTPTGAVQVSRIRVAAQPAVTFAAILEPFDPVTLPGTGWTQTGGPTTTPGSPAPAGLNGYTLTYAGAGQATITVRPHTVYYNAACTQPAQVHA